MDSQYSPQLTVSDPLLTGSTLCLWRKVVRDNCLNGPGVPGGFSTIARGSGIFLRIVGHDSRVGAAGPTSLHRIEILFGWLLSTPEDFAPHHNSRSSVKILPRPTATNPPHGSLSLLRRFYVCTYILGTNRRVQLTMARLRLGYTKSRTGCLRCKQRRVKVS